MPSEHAKIAQLVEHNLAKVGVAGSSPVFRSKCPNAQMAESVDALVSGTSVRKDVQVRVLFWVLFAKVVELVDTLL